MTKSNVSLAGINFSEEDIQAMKEGQVLGGVNGLQSPTTHTPVTSTPIQGYGQNLKPRIRDAQDKPVVQELVTKARMDRNNSSHAAQMLALAEEKDAKETEQRELAAFMDAASLRSQIEFLNRSVKKLTKEINSLKATKHDS